LTQILNAAPRRVMSAASMVELGIVLSSRFGQVGSAILERFLRAAEIEVVTLDRDQAERALEAWQRFGRGNHPAGLNFGDCFAYALATVDDWPILCTGNEFSQTDAAVVQP
jgi:ribonuclease VapC